MSFNWAKFEQWRGHPMLNNNLRHALPGFGIGLGAFAVYLAYHKMTTAKGHGH